jgi:hypothetical protein
MVPVMRNENRKGRRWGVTVFRGEEGEEVRWLNGARGAQHNEEWRGG